MTTQHGTRMVSNYENRNSRTCLPIGPSDAQISCDSVISARSTQVCEVGHHLHGSIHRCRDRIREPDGFVDRRGLAPDDQDAATLTAEAPDPGENGGRRSRMASMMIRLSPVVCATASVIESDEPPDGSTNP